MQAQLGLMLAVAGKHQYLLSQRLLPLTAAEGALSSGALVVAAEASGVALTGESPTSARRAGRSA